MISLAGTTVSDSHAHACPEIGAACNDTLRPEPLPYRHDLGITPVDLSVTVAVGLRQNLGAEVYLPLRIIRSRINFTTPAGAPYDPATDDISDFHHHNKTYARISDPRLLLILGHESADWGFSTRLGFTIPLGRTEENPFELGRQGAEHQHFQWGTGVVSPVVGLGLSRFMGSVSLSLTALAQISAGRNNHGYKAGHIYNGAALARLISQPLGLSWQAGLSVYHETREDWSNSQVTGEGNLGRTDILASVHISRALGPGAVNLSLSIPISLNTVGSQLSYPALVGMSFSGAFVEN